MTWNVERIDRAKLPGDLLDLAKAQSRVTHDRDDAYITELLGQAIDDVERSSNAFFFDRTVTGVWSDWSAVPYWRGQVAVSPNDCYAVRLPFNNVRDFTALDTEGTDVSDAYAVDQTDPGGVGSAVLVGPIPSVPHTATDFSFDIGVTAATNLAPAVRRAILRRCAALYENRESTEGLSTSPEAGEPMLWRPDV